MLLGDVALFQKITNTLGDDGIHLFAHNRLLWFDEKKEKSQLLRTKDRKPPTAGQVQRGSLQPNQIVAGCFRQEFDRDLRR